MLYFVHSTRIDWELKNARNCIAWDEAEVMPQSLPYAWPMGLQSSKPAITDCIRGARHVHFGQVAKCHNWHLIPIEAKWNHHGIYSELRKQFWHLIFKFQYYHSCQPTPQPQQRQIWAMSATYTTAQGNAGSLAHWARPEIQSTTSWFLVDSFPLHHNGNSLSLSFITGL